MDDIVIPVNSPVDSRTDHNFDSPACHSRDWDSSIQVKSEQLQHSRLTLKSYGDDQERLQHNDSSESLVDPIAATGSDGVGMEMCIGHNTTNKLSNIQQHGLSDSPETELVTKAAPDDDERLEFTTSVPDSDDGHNVNGTQKPLACILYSKADDPKNNVLELANLLNILGCNCEIDQYYSSDKEVSSFWELWIEQVVKKTSNQNGCVLIACSPALHQAFNSMNSSSIEMKFGHINNRTLHCLIVDESISSHVIPIFLEQFDKKYIPNCLLRTNAYVVNIDKVLEVFSPYKARSNDEVDIKLLLSTPGLESFQSLLYRLNGEQEFIKPSKSADITALPSSKTSIINNQQIRKLQSGHLPLDQAQWTQQTPSNPETSSHPFKESCHPGHGHRYNVKENSFSCLSVLSVKKNFKQLVSIAFCNRHMLHKAFLTVICIVIVTICLFLYLVTS